MPEFVQDLGGGADQFSALDSFTQGYITAAFWTAQDETEGAAFNELATETLASMIEECRDFQALAADDLARAYEHESIAYDAERAGVDFWLTRNGHGAGFWDRGLGDLRTDTIGGRLSRDAKSFGGCDLYRGDDGKIYT